MTRRVWQLDNQGRPVRLVLMLVLATIVAGCGNESSSSEAPVFGDCRFCKKPGYSTNRWLSPSSAQKAADEGDKEVTGTIVCGDCREKMGVPK